MAGFFSFSRNIGSGQRPAGSPARSQAFSGMNGMLVKRPDPTGITGQFYRRGSAMPAGDGGSFITTGGGGGGGGGGVLNPDNKPKWSTLMADAMKNRAQSTLDLEARRQASQTAAKQAVTSRLDSEARQIADRTAARNARGVYGPDGSAITGARKVRVTNDTGKLKELEDANYYKNQQANIDKQYEADLASAALQTGTSVQQLKDRIQQRLNPKPYVAPKKRR